MDRRPLRAEGGWGAEAYPFNLPVVRDLDELTFHPDAWIYQTTARGLERVEYEDTDHYQVTRNFLNRRQVFLDALLSDD